MENVKIRGGRLIKYSESGLVMIMLFFKINLETQIVNLSTFVPGSLQIAYNIYSLCFIDIFCLLFITSISDTIDCLCSTLFFLFKMYKPVLSSFLDPERSRIYHHCVVPSKVARSTF